MNIIGVIPARYASTRFPGKPLALLAGKPLIQHVVERCQRAKTLSEVIVATDDPRIQKAVQSFCRVEMTSSKHPSGTDRVAEVLARTSADAALNVQGDEPLIDPKVIDSVLQRPELLQLLSRLESRHRKFHQPKQCLTPISINPKVLQKWKCRYLLRKRGLSGFAHIRNRTP